MYQVDETSVRSPWSLPFCNGPRLHVQVRKQKASTGSMTTIHKIKTPNTLYLGISTHERPTTW